MSKSFSVSRFRDHITSRNIHAGCCKVFAHTLDRLGLGLENNVPDLQVFERVSWIDECLCGHLECFLHTFNFSSKIGEKGSPGLGFLKNGGKKVRQMSDEYP